MTRTFEDKPAVRERTPLLVGLVGPSGSGKTWSALRLATGIRRIAGGEIFLIDTEARRALHYSEDFAFRHVDFGKPFSPADYLAAIEHCAAKGAGTIIIDSMSHEHAGQGGVLEMHEAELDRIAGSDYKKRQRCSMLAWSRPKQERAKLIAAMLQIPCNFLMCYRAKEKYRMESGKEPELLGFQPIAGEEFIYEMGVKFLLLPGADGVPAWKSDYPGERAMFKIPNQFREMFATPEQLSESHGEALARWAAGTPADLAAICEVGGPFRGKRWDAIVDAKFLAWCVANVPMDKSVALARLAQLSAAPAAKEPERDPATGETLPPEGAK